MIRSIANLVNQLSPELPNDSRLRILGNKEILEKSEIWVKTESSAQSTFKKLSFGCSSQKTRESRCQSFLVFSSYTGFLQSLQNILDTIVWANNFLILTRSRLLQTLIFWHFVFYQGISPFIKENITQVSCVKIPNLTVLCKQYFPCYI